MELCNHKSSIVKERRQEHYSNPSRFPQIEVKAHEDTFLYWITSAWKKCDLLGLADQKEILNTIIEEVRFRSNDEGPTKEPFLQETQEECHHEATKVTPYDDVETFKYLPFQNNQDAKCHDLLSDLISVDPIIHYDYWSSYGLP